MGRVLKAIKPVVYLQFDTQSDADDPWSVNFLVIS